MLAKATAREAWIAEPARVMPATSGRVVDPRTRRIAYGLSAAVVFLMVVVLRLGSSWMGCIRTGLGHGRRCEAGTSRPCCWRHPSSGGR